MFLEVCEIDNKSDCLVKICESLELNRNLKSHFDQGDALFNIQSLECNFRLTSNPSNSRPFAYEGHYQMRNPASQIILR